MDLGALAVSLLRGAMTNEVFRITWLSGEAKGNDQRKVLVHIYGRGVEVFFDRAPLRAILFGSAGRPARRYSHRTLCLPLPCRV